MVETAKKYRQPAAFIELRLLLMICGTSYAWTLMGWSLGANAAIRDIEAGALRITLKP